MRAQKAHILELFVTGPLEPVCEGREQGGGVGGEDEMQKRRIERKKKLRTRNGKSL